MTEKATGDWWVDGHLDLGSGQVPESPQAAAKKPADDSVS